MNYKVKTVICLLQTNKDRVRSWNVNNNLSHDRTSSTFVLDTKNGNSKQDRT